MLSESNSPLPCSAVKKTIRPPSQSSVVSHKLLFEISTIPFLFEKKGKNWKELPDGKTEFLFEQETSSIVIKGTQTSSPSLFHKISVLTKLQKQVHTSKCWVFRAVHCVSGIHDVLCLQFTETIPFATAFEKHRLACLQELEPKASRSTSSPAFQTGTTARVVKGGKDLENGSMELKATSNHLFRRRLSDVGTNPHIDGHSPGARFEPAVIQASPTMRSPIKRKASSLNMVPELSMITFSGISVKGKSHSNPDKPNQDSMVMHQLPEGELLFAVFDGHGSEGHDVSGYFKHRFPSLLAKHNGLADDSKNFLAIKECLDQTERELIDTVKVDTTLSGSTGIVALIRGDQLFVANVGDSRAVFGIVDKDSKGHVTAVDVSQDHKPDLPAEQQRIQEVGGRVFAIKFDDGIDGPARVWLSYADYPGLAMSRSFGDTIAKEAGVIAEPDLFQHTLTLSHKFLVLASDGLWEFMTSQEVVDIVNKYRPDQAELAIQELVKESNQRWRANEPVVDDTSIVIAYFV